MSSSTTVKPKQLPWSRAKRRLVAGTMLVLAAILSVASYFLPMWELTLEAPQYPDGLTAEIVGTGLRGDVREIDILNHYIGFAKLETLGQPELTLWPYGIAFLAFIFVLAAFLHNRFGSLIAWAGATYPIIFFVDLYRWLYMSGHNLDPGAPMSSSIEPFMPGIFGRNKIAQFETVAWFGLGFWATVVASVLAIIAGIIMWKKKPKSDETTA